MAPSFHPVEMSQSAPRLAILVCERLGFRLSRHIRNSYRQPVADGSLLISCLISKGPKPESWRDKLWLFMTAAGVVLLVCAALSV